MSVTGSDLAEMLHTIANYCHGVDFGDAVLFASSFTDDGLLEETFGMDAPFTTIRGRNALIEYVRAAHRAIPHMKFGRHWISNLRVIDERGNQVSTVCFVNFINILDGGSSLVNGVYEDVFQKTDGTWRMSHRLARLDATREQAEARMGRLAEQATKVGVMSSGASPFFAMSAR
jgi:hypothetical protein